MGLEYICDRCGAPMCAFTYQVKVSSTGKAYQERVCLNCVRIQKECGHDVPSRFTRRSESFPLKVADTS